MDYFDNVLIKLRRQYSKDETVAALSKEISELEIENGALLFCSNFYFKQLH